MKKQWKRPTNRSQILHKIVAQVPPRPRSSRAWQPSPSKQLRAWHTVLTKGKKIFNFPESRQRKYFSNKGEFKHSFHTIIYLNQEIGFLNSHWAVQLAFFLVGAHGGIIPVEFWSLSPISKRLWPQLTSRKSISRECLGGGIISRSPDLSKPQNFLPHQVVSQ